MSDVSAESDSPSGEMTPDANASGGASEEPKDTTLAPSASDSAGVAADDEGDPKRSGENEKEVTTVLGSNEDNGLDTSTMEIDDTTHEGSPEDDVGTAAQGGAKDDADDGIYNRLRGTALAAINVAREARQLWPLCLDAALEVPATAHCRNMCEHGFLSHWDITGRKPYQRYSDFAYGQHVSEVVFGFDLGVATESEMSTKIKTCIEERAAEDTVQEGGLKNNHLLNGVHTHIGIGVFSSEGKLRYVEAYADRYLELHDAPVELTAANAASGFQISVQMVSAEVGPYACLVFHDPIPIPMTVAELQQQFSGPYMDFTPAQVGIVWPWEMEVLDDGIFDIPISVTPDEPGTYYVQIFTCCDPSSIPYDAEPADGLPLPGDSFCGGAIVLKAPEHTIDESGISYLDGADGSLVDKDSYSPEEREARSMASTTALRRDLPPIVSIRVLQEIGLIAPQDDGFEQAVFMPLERAENKVQLNLGVQFLRLGTWDDSSAGGRCSEETVSTGVTTPMKATGGESGEVDKAETKGEANDAAVPLCNNTEEDVQKAGEVGTEATVAAVETDGAKAADSQRDGKIVDKAGIGGNSGDVEGTATFDNQTEGEGIAAEMSGTEPVDVKLEGGMPCVVTEIRVVTFGEGEKVHPPEGFELVPDDLASPVASTTDSLRDGEVDNRTERKAQDREAVEEKAAGGQEEEETARQDKDRVFLCIKRVPYTENVSPVTDLALVYGTEGFQMGFGFVTVAMPQVVNEAYGSVIHLCHKSAGASLAVIQQVAEQTAEKTAKQIQQHLGIKGDDTEDKANADEDEAYDIDTTMTQEQMLEWEEKRNREAAERAYKREQAERERKRREASDALQHRMEEALKEKEELLKMNAEWQKKIAALMLTQQKTREEARTEHGGRGVEREAIPVHESEKHYAECLAAIVAYRERLQEQQTEYDTVAIALQTRLDEKEYKSREIAESFRDFKREIARTAEHSRTGKSIPKGVIAQFEAAETKKDEEIEKVRLKNINLRMMLKKVEGNLRTKEQLAEGLHLIDFEQLKIENQTVNEKIEERNEELLKLKKKNTTTVQILTHTKEKLQFVVAENAVTSRQLSGLEEDLNQERDCLTHAKKEKDSLRTEVANLRQSQGFANSDLLILDFEKRKSHLKKLGQKLDEMRSKHYLLLLEQERLQESNEQRAHELTGMQP